MSETTPKNALRAVVATLQDEGYIIQNVVPDVGLVVAIHDRPVHRERDDAADIIDDVGSVLLESHRLHKPLRYARP